MKSIPGCEPVPYNKLCLAVTVYPHLSSEKIIYEIFFLIVGRFIVELAAMNNGVIVSNDQYRDLMATNPQWRPVIERQLLQYTVVGDLFMFPQDPLGRDGPTLDVFLGASNRYVRR